MAIPLPALNVQYQPSESLTDQYGKVLSLRNMMQQGQLHQEQLKGAQLENVGREQENTIRARQIQDQQTVMDTLGKYKGDIDAALPELGSKVSPTTFMGLKKYQLEVKQKIAEIDKDKLPVLQDQNNRIQGLIQQVSQLPDEQYIQQWPQIAAAAKEIKPDLKMDLSQPIPKEQLAIFGLQSMTLGNAIEKQKAADEAKSAAAKLPGEVANSQKAVKVNAGTNAQGVTAAEQLTAQLGSRRLAEEQRHNQATEGATNVPAQAQMLVEGQLDPSQLQKRGSTYGAILSAADAYSRQKYGKPFDVAKATQDYKFASNVGTQNTLKYLNSLTGANGKPGNLDTLIGISNNISRTNFPSLNDVAAWARLQTGDPAMAQYHTALTEVSDQVAKILQGGGTGTSDAKLRQAQDLFNSGFSKDQIKAVGTTLRDLLSNRKRELIGDNTYLQRSYGNSSAPQGKPVYVDGKIVGYTTDGKTMSPAQ